MFKLRLKELRNLRGLTQEQLAAELNISSSTISAYERGIREPSLETISAIAGYFSVDQGFLLGDSPIRKKYVFNKDGNHEFDRIINKILMMDNFTIIKILEKLLKMNDNELDLLNNILK
jgi:transcriptional regulator with XRE-family HTH domain